MSVHTLTVWRVAPGREEDFVALWRELADWTQSRFPHARGTLLRDRDDPTRFISFGPWSSTDEVAAWRGASEFGALAERLRGVLVDFQPGIFDTVVQRRA